MQDIYAGFAAIKPSKRTKAKLTGLSCYPFSPYSTWKAMRERLTPNQQQTPSHTTEGLLFRSLATNPSGTDLGRFSGPKAERQDVAQQSLPRERSERIGYDRGSAPVAQLIHGIK